MGEGERGQGERRRRGGAGRREEDSKKNNLRARKPPDNPRKYIPKKASQDRELPHFKNTRSQSRLHWVSCPIQARAFKTEGQSLPARPNHTCTLKGQPVRWPLPPGTHPWLWLLPLLPLGWNQESWVPGGQGSGDPPNVHLSAAFLLLILLVS